MSFQHTPVFLDHGTKDRKMPIELAYKAADRLKSMAMDVCWNDYDDLGHWHSTAMLGDSVTFLRTKGVGKMD